MSQPLLKSGDDPASFRHGVVSRIARQLDVGPETLRHWIRQAEIDAGIRLGTTSAERDRIAELEKENRELRPVEREGGAPP